MQLSTYVESWSPGPVTDEDPLPAGPVAALSAVLDLSGTVAGEGDPLPPLWHWLYFLGWPAQRELGADGHPSNGHFLPPLPDRQRMWAGGRCEIAEPLRLGAPAERVSGLASVTAKQGRTGELLFVTERREFRQRGRTCLVEEQDIVYRSGRGAGRHPATVEEFAAPHTDDPWRLGLRPDPATLFRFSALTANAHRIHYDTPYCRDEEGYPGLVVHGPLLALLMLELPRRYAPARPVRSLSYRLHRPVFGGEDLAACGTPGGGGAELRIATHREERHATAEVSFA
jgi:hydroxyacyl-ACP dehydratase HTD2-like protein with hotdog domain